MFGFTSKGETAVVAPKRGKIWYKTECRNEVRVFPVVPLAVKQANLPVDLLREQRDRNASRTFTISYHPRLYVREGHEPTMVDDKGL